MFNMEDILARLAAGENADAIATEFTNALNGAVQEQAKQDAARQKENEKLADAQAIVDMTCDFLDKWYPEVGTAGQVVDAADVLEVLDQVIPELTAMTKLLAKLDKVLDEPVKVKVKTATKPCADPFKAFFSAHNL